jgi:large subunit ribosomal protein L33
MAKKSTEARIIITLACTDCQERNYTSTKNRRNDTQRLELRKYCSRCRTHRGHREVR